jgi:D-sedoheptulose 7-phosphate isomerase
MQSLHHWHRYSQKLSNLLNSISIQDKDGNKLAVNDGFQSWEEWTCAIRSQHKTIFLIGNGASASMASHMAADLAKNAHVHSEVFTDLSLITAISNDIGYDQVFAEPLRRRAKSGDMLVAISSSGRSPNILAAVKIAQEFDLKLITLSAMTEDNPLRASGHLNYYVKAHTYGEAETCHSAILHFWMDSVVVKNN